MCATFYADNLVLRFTKICVVLHYKGPALKNLVIKNLQVK